jgi:SAM-dependent methyltransferase
VTRLDDERAHWDGLGATLESAQANVFSGLPPDAGLLACLFAIAPALRKGRILDLGCGVGRLAIPIARAKAFAGYRTGEDLVLGVDISEAMLGHAGAAAREAGLTLQHLAFGYTDGRSLPDVRLHSAYSVLLFQHLPPDAVQSYLRQVAVLLVGGGVFRFQFCEAAGESFEEGPFSFGYSASDMCTWCRDAGLVVDDIDQGLIHPSWTWITARKAWA